MTSENEQNLTQEVTQLVTKYNFSWDSERFDEVASCFTPDGVFVDATGTPHEGRLAIEEFGRQSTAIFGSMRHITTNHAISQEEIGWVHRCYILFAWGIGRPDKTSATGRYRDTFVLTDEGPLFTRRHVILDA